MVGLNKYWKSHAPKRRNVETCTTAKWYRGSRAVSCLFDNKLPVYFWMQAAGPMLHYWKIAFGEFIYSDLPMLFTDQHSLEPKTTEWNRVAEIQSFTSSNDNCYREQALHDVWSKSCLSWGHEKMVYRQYQYVCGFYSWSFFLSRKIKQPGET